MTPAQPEGGVWPPREGDRACSTLDGEVVTFNGHRNNSGGYDVIDASGRHIGGIGKLAVDGGHWQLIGPAPREGELRDATIEAIRAAIAKWRDVGNRTEASISWVQAEHLLKEYDRLATTKTDGGTK